MPCWINQPLNVACMEMDPVVEPEKLILGSAQLGGTHGGCCESDTTRRRSEGMSRCRQRLVSRYRYRRSRDYHYEHISFSMQHKINVKRAYALVATLFMKLAGMFADMFTSLIRLNRSPMTRLTGASATPEATGKSIKTQAPWTNMG